MSRSMAARIGAILPRELTARLRALRALPAGARRRYAVSLLLRRIGRTRLRRGGATPRLLFVCHGNIIRSVLAAALVRREAAQRGMALEAASAGLEAIAGRPADPRAVTAAAELGIALDGHRAQPVTAQLLAASDYVIVMDYCNEAALVSRFPECAARAHLLAPGAAVPDPFTGSLDDVRRCAAQIAAAVATLTSDLAGA